MKLPFLKTLIGLALLLVVQTAQSPVGTWKLQVEWPNGTVEVTVMVSGTAGELRAVWGGPQGEIELEDVAFAEDILTFVFIVRNSAGEGVALPFEGRIDGDVMDGVLHLPNGTDAQADGERQS